MSIGMSRRTAVSEHFADKGAFEYTGQIDRVRIEPGVLAPGSLEEPSEEIFQAKLRATGVQETWRPSMTALHESGFLRRWPPLLGTGVSIEVRTSGPDVVNLTWLARIRRFL